MLLFLYFIKNWEELEIDLMDIVILSLELELKRDFIFWRVFKLYKLIVDVLLFGRVSRLFCFSIILL